MFIREKKAGNRSYLALCRTYKDADSGKTKQASVYIGDLSNIGRGQYTVFNTLAGRSKWNYIIERIQLTMVGKSFGDPDASKVRATAALKKAVKAYLNDRLMPMDTAASLWKYLSAEEVYARKVEADRKWQEQTARRNAQEKDRAGFRFSSAPNVKYTENAMAAFKRLATYLHPDKPTGNTEMMQNLNIMRDALK